MLTVRFDACARGIMRGARIFVIAFGLWQPQTALAGDVKDIIGNLYGGDGVTLGGSTPGHTAHFDADGAAALSNLSGAIAAAASIFSLNSTVTGITFDIEQGIPVRTTESLGPILAERASTIGKGKLNLGLAFSRADFKRFEGDDLDSLGLSFTHGTGGTTGCAALGDPLSPDYCNDTVGVNIDLELEQNTLGLFGTYGVTENWDVGVVVPLVYVKAKVRSRAAIVRDRSIGFPTAITHAFSPTSGDQPVESREEDAFGIGDVILRTKYDLSDLLQSKQDPVTPDLGVLGQVSLATGDEDDLLGLGETSFLGLLIASKQFDWFSPHVNLGYEVTTGDAEFNNLRYVAGFDARLHQQVTGSIDVIGRWHPDGDGVRDLIDVAVGGKWDPFDIGAPFSANVLIPINKNTGLRANVIWSVGFEMTF